MKKTPQKLISSPKRRPSLVLFDMDGVLFDTMPAHADSWHSTAKAYGLEATREEFYLYEGQKGSDTIKHLYKRQYGKDAPEEFVNEVYNHKTSLFREQAEINLIPGVDKLIEYFKRNDIRVGVVTGSSKGNALDRIKTFFSDHIDLNNVITADDCTHGKPAPEPYQKGMALFDADPKDTLVIENAPYGVEAAAKSHAFVVAVMTGPVPEKVLYDNGADIVLPNMDSVMDWWTQNYDNV
ncbi:HAD family phosphatase [Porphyromonas sp.]|uniref:HAD family hydrolase n=1 Tax=Porphyromonas sp. TaxID=1924944 RepID=UPI0026DCB7B2|nr:HAD-IA family hydrolase [Porphyromonas sp.]MDO4770714.1 HAD-IA family hydrolase [Porphyromonas sp.]